MELYLFSPECLRGVNRDDFTFTLAFFKMVNHEMKTVSHQLQDVVVKNSSEDRVCYRGVGG